VRESTSLFQHRTRPQGDCLSEEEIDELLREAEDDHWLRRLGFLKKIYRGDSIPEAADREGRSSTTGGRWVDTWNEGGIEALMPSFGGRPPRTSTKISNKSWLRCSVERHGLTANQPEWLNDVVDE
jgi:transposase